MSAPTPHTLVVALREGDEEELDYTITCPGTAAGGCQPYRTCAELVEHDSEQLWEDPELHGVEHQQIDGEWMVPVAGCWVIEAEGYDGTASELRLVPGTYRVDFDGSTYDDFQLYLVA